MNYKIGDKVWVYVNDEIAEFYYCGPAVIREIFTEFNWDYEIEAPINHFMCGIKREEIKYKL